MTNADDLSVISALKAWGIQYFAPSEITPDPIPPEDLLPLLAEHENPRLRLAIIPLLLLHPEWSELISTFSTPATLQKYYTAAVCLQRMWSIRLGFYLGKQKLLPDLFSAKMDLPPADLMYGKACLNALARRETFNQLSAYLGVLDLLFAQLIQQTQNEPAALR
jgi:hypothetical protein